MVLLAVATFPDDADPVPPADPAAAELLPRVQRSDTCRPRHRLAWYLVVTLAMALGVPLRLCMVRRVEKHHAWSIAAVGMIAAPSMLPALEPGADALHPMIAIMACFGFFLGLSSIALAILARRLANRQEIQA